jgi:RNA-binding protein
MRTMGSLMPLTTKIRQEYKAKAHKLKPVVLIGNKGLSDSVKKEINSALEIHELIKVRIQSNDREERQRIFTEICEDAEAERIQLIGSIGIIFRKRKDKK